MIFPDVNGTFTKALEEFVALVGHKEGQATHWGHLVTRPCAVDVTATMAWPSLPRGKHGKTTGITVEIG
jgi:hypothetical protein